MKLLRQVFSVPLVVAFICFNTQSADLHVHAASEEAEAGHHHAASVHQHHVSVPSREHEARLTAVDADDTVILVRFSAASASSPRSAAASCIEVAAPEPSRPAVVSGPGIVARAHGPPGSRPDSLRAPPASSPL